MAHQTAKIRILIADDHPVVVQGLRHALSSRADAVVVGDASDGIEVLNRLRTHRVDLILLDLCMPHGGVKLLGSVVNRYPHTRVIALGAHSDEQVRERAELAGASSFFHKASGLDELHAKIERIFESNAVLPNASAAGELSPMDERLSKREADVMGRIVAGKSLTTIAGEFGISVKTVSTYRTRILQKLRMRTNAELIAYAVRMDLGT